MKEITKENSAINHPKHYTQGEIECIDAMIAAFGKEKVATFCAISAFKYLWRGHEKENLIQDYGKAVWYIEKATSLLNTTK